MKKSGYFKRCLAVGLLAASSISFAADWAPGSTDWDKLPEIKRSKLALYLTLPPASSFFLRSQDALSVK